ERRAAIAAATDACRATMDAFAAAGLPCDVVTGAGTGTFEFEAASGVYTELQCGSYAFMDADYGRNLDHDGRPIAAFEQALFVWSTVMSVPARDRAVCDAGLKAIAFDSGPPLVAGRDGIEYAGPSDEHGTLRVAATNKPPRLGEKIRLIPGHCDPTVNLHDWYVGIRDGRVEAVWPIAARGAMT
ncbi:MAG: DSD1 family PLP-dependent enzyme, partial [Alphaproteobacteria bacterium]|nr:DSD1 family PLP-dependent enzyme [Alphaproteobacteria bacterium]